MRNLDEYPITISEVFEALNWAIAAADEVAGVGDVRAVALARAKKIVELVVTEPLDGADA